MQKMRMQELPEMVELKERIIEWRRNKTTRRMPESLWEELVVAGKQHGVSPVASFFRTDYVSLKMRILKQEESLVQGRPRSQKFVELPIIASAQRNGIEIELTHSSATVRVRSTDSSMDWEKLFTGWLRATSDQRFI